MTRFIAYVIIVYSNCSAYNDNTHLSNKQTVSSSPQSRLLLLREEHRSQQLPPASLLAILLMLLRIQMIVPLMLRLRDDFPSFSFKTNVAQPYIFAISYSLFSLKSDPNSSPRPLPLLPPPLSLFSLLHFPRPISVVSSSSSFRRRSFRRRRA